MNLLIVLLCCGEVSQTWTVDRPLADLATSVVARFDKPSQLPPEALIAMIGKIEWTLLGVRAMVEAVPAQHYYKATLTLDPPCFPRFHGSKTLELQGQGSATRCRSVISLTFGRNGRAVRWLLDRAEVKLLSWERQELCGLVGDG